MPLGGGNGENMLRSLMGAGLGGGRSGGRGMGFPSSKEKTVVGEKVLVEPLALLKMLRRAAGGLPFEVMGVLLGVMVNDETILIRDVLDMPLIASTVAVDAMDPGFQLEMSEALKETGRDEQFLGWYHSHAGSGCFLNPVARETQQGFEGIQPRAIAVVVDPVQSVKGRVVMESFRVIPSNPILELLSLFMSQPPIPPSRHVNALQPLAYLAGPDHRKMLSRGLDRHFYKLHSGPYLPKHFYPILRSIGRQKRRETEDVPPSFFLLASPPHSNQSSAIQLINSLEGLTNQLTTRLSSPGPRRPTVSSTDQLSRSMADVSLTLLHSQLLNSIRSTLLRTTLSIPRVNSASAPIATL